MFDLTMFWGAGNLPVSVRNIIWGAFCLSRTSLSVSAFVARKPGTKPSTARTAARFAAGPRDAKGRGNVRPFKKRKSSATLWPKVRRKPRGLMCRPLPRRRTRRERPPLGARPRPLPPPERRGWPRRRSSEQHSCDQKIFEKFSDSHFSKKCATTGNRTRMSDSTRLPSRPRYSLRYAGEFSRFYTISGLKVVGGKSYTNLILQAR